MINFRTVMSRWPDNKINNLARDLGEKPDTVRRWEYRNSIPSNKFHALLAAARKRGIKLTCKELIEAAAE